MKTPDSDLKSVRDGADTVAEYARRGGRRLRRLAAAAQDRWRAKLDPYLEAAKSELQASWEETDAVDRDRVGSFAQAVQTGSRRFAQAARRGASWTRHRLVGAGRRMHAWTVPAAGATRKRVQEGRGRARAALSDLADGELRERKRQLQKRVDTAFGGSGVAHGLHAFGLVIAVVGLMAVLSASLATPLVVGANRLVTGVGDQLDDIPPLPESLAQPAQRSTVLASDGSLLATLYEENRVIVPLERIPEHVRQAVLAIEDVRFYEHDGIDARGTARAFVTNMRSGRASEGGSTITQQYVKNVLLTSETTMERKVVEAIYAVELERRKSKDEILEGYLNVAYFGQGVYGIAAAAQFYYGVEVEDLTVAQAAVLAGTLANPTNFEPIVNPERAEARRNTVISRMAGAGFITEAEATTARAEPIEAVPHPLPETVQPFFVEYVKQLLLDDPALGETREERIQVLFASGVTVETTIDPKVQEDAEEAIRAHLTDPAEDPLGAVVSVDPRTGEIRAMAIGPREFGVCPEDETEVCNQMKMNPIVPGMGGSGRQPGSSFKPILAAAALEAGIPTSWHAEADPGDAIPGCGAPGVPWEPRNYSDGSAGTMDMVDAMRVSNNVFHALLIAEVGPPAVVEMAEKLGFTREIPAVCAIALGSAEVFPLEMASAFGVFANGGVHCTSFAVSRVVAADGSVLIDREPDCEQVISEETAATMTTLLRNVITSGTGTAAGIGRDAAGKTGTTDDHRDAWFVGYTPQLTTAAWVGYEVPKEMTWVQGVPRVTGGSIPARIWSSYMRAALDGVEVIAMPDVTLDRYTPPRRERTTRPPGRDRSSPPGRDRTSDDDSGDTSDDTSDGDSGGTDTGSTDETPPTDDDDD